MRCDATLAISSHPLSGRRLRPGVHRQQPPQQTLSQRARLVPSLLCDIVMMVFSTEGVLTMKCLNRNVLIGLAAAAVALFFLAPGARNALPLLLLLACPLAMVLMVFGMSKMKPSGGSCATNQTDPQRKNELKDAEIARLETMLQNSNRTDHS